MTDTISKEFFEALRADRLAVIASTRTDRIASFVQSAMVTSEISGDSILDEDRLMSLLMSSNLFDEEVEQRLAIAEITTAISSLQPSQRALKPGVYMVVGRTGKGKTRWLREMLSTVPNGYEAILLNHDEPMLDSDEFGTSCGLRELIDSFDLIRQSPRLNVVALDGVRTIQYESTGNTLSGGVNSGFFRFLTDAGNAAVRSGVVCLFTYNPNTEKEETYQLVSAMVDGSVQGIINLDNQTISSRYHKRESFPISRSHEVLFQASPDFGSAMSSDATTSFDTTEI